MPKASKETVQERLLVDAVREILDLTPLYDLSEASAAEAWMMELAISSEIWLEKEESINDFWVDPIEEEGGKSN